MIQGEFNERGELFFEIGLMSSDGEIISVMALLDTGFTGWLAIEHFPPTSPVSLAILANPVSPHVGPHEFLILKYLIPFCTPYPVANTP